MEAYTRFRQGSFASKLRGFVASEFAGLVLGLTILLIVVSVDGRRPDSRVAISTHDSSAGVSVFESSNSGSLRTPTRRLVGMPGGISAFGTGWSPFTVGPIVTATMADMLVVDDMNPGMADPGDTLRYTVIITNSGDGDAEDLEFEATVDVNSTLVPGSVVTTPIAINDTLSATGNIPIEAAASGVLANDAGSGLSVSEVNGSGANVGVATATTLAGSVTLLADGSFTYTPPPGIEGTDTFTYVATGPGGTSNEATVRIEISDMVWFIDNTAGGLDLGTFDDPFGAIAAFNTVNGLAGTQPNPKDGDIIALRTGSGTYGTVPGISLRDGQILIGEGVALNSEFVASSNSSAAYKTFAATAGTAPVITASAGNGITLGSGNTIRGLGVGNTTGVGITGFQVGTLTISDVSISGTGEAFDITEGMLDVTFSSINSTSSGAQGIDLADLSGTMTVTGSTSLSDILGNGIDILNSTAKIHFDGGVSVASTGSGSVGLNIQTDTVTIGGSTNTVSTPSGTPIVLDGVDLGPGGWTFSNVSSSGGAGIDLNNVSGTFSVTGGTINSGAGIGVRINGGADDVTIGAAVGNTMLKSVEVSNRTGGTVTFSGAVNDTGTGVSLTGNTGATITFSGGLTLNVGSAAAFTATGGGTVNVTGANNTIVTSTGVGVNIVNTTIGSSGVTFKSVSVTGAPSGIVLNNTGTSGDFTVTGDGVDTSLGGNDSGGVLHMTTGDAIDLDNTFGVNIRSMRILTPGGDGIDAFNLAGTSTIRYSTITDVDATNTSAVRVQNTTASLADLFVEDSRFTNALTGQTMFLVEGGGNGGITMQVRIDGSEFSDLDPAAYQHIAGLSVGDNPTVKTFFTNNSVINAKVGSVGSSEVNLLKSHSANSVFVVEGNSFHDVGLFGVINGILNVGGNSAMIGGTITGLIKNNEFSDLPGKARAVNVIVEAVSGAPGLVDITMDGNKFDDLLDVTLNDATAIHVEMRNDAPSSNLRIINNSIGAGVISGTTPGAVGGTRDGVFIQVDDEIAKTMNLLMANNTVSVTNTGVGATGDQLVEINADDNLTRINATIIGNVFNNAGTGDVSVRSDALGSTICLDLNAANTTPNAGNQTVAVVRDATAIYEIEGMAAGPHTDAAVEAFLAARNTIAVDALGDLGGGFGNNGGAACPEPPAAPVISPVLEQVNDPEFSSAPWDDPFMIVNEPAAGSNQAAPVTRVESSGRATSANDLMIERAIEQRLQVEARSAVGGTQRSVANAAAKTSSSGETVNLMLGTLPAGASVQITFEVAIDDPFPSEVSLICTQGTVTFLNFPDVLTDDPDVGGAEDPTCTEVVTPPLPVELTSFDYLIDDASELLLRWSTASESDNAGFEVQQALIKPATEEIERERTDLVWNTLAFVSGAGTTTQVRDYTFAVALKDPGLYAFRLKQIDLDGGFSFSSILEVDLEVPRQLMLSPNYPNPFNPATRLTFTVPLDGRATVDVYNILGQQVARLFDGQAAAGRVYALSFEASSLSTGDYVAVLRFSGRQVVQRMVLLR